MTVSTMLWFERLSSQMRVPTWAGAIIIAGIPLLLTGAVVSYAYRILPLPVQACPVAIAAGTYYLLACRHARRKIEELREYSESISSGKQPLAMNALYGYRGIIAVWVLLNLVTIPVFILSRAGFVLSIGRVIVEQSPWIPWMITLATFVWTTGYSLFNIYRMSNLPLGLKSFTEDTTLGLRPFASVTLRLTLLYVIGVAIIAIPTVLVRGPGQTVVLPLAFFVGLTLLALALFVLPMLGLRNKLILAKREKLRWIGQRYTTIVKKLEESIEENVHEKLLRELMVIDKLQRDIKQINTWPFDVGIFLKLTAMILSVVAILIARVLQSFLQL